MQNLVSTRTLATKMILPAAIFVTMLLVFFLGNWMDTPIRYYIYWNNNFQCVCLASSKTSLRMDNGWWAVSWYLCTNMSFSYFIIWVIVLPRLLHDSSRLFFAINRLFVYDNNLMIAVKHLWRLHILTECIFDITGYLHY